MVTTALQRALLAIQMAVLIIQMAVLDIQNAVGVGLDLVVFCHTVREHTHLVVGICFQVQSLAH